MHCQSKAYANKVNIKNLHGGTIDMMTTILTKGIKETNDIKIRLDVLAGMSNNFTLTKMYLKILLQTII